MEGRDGGDDGGQRGKFASFDHIQHQNRGADPQVFGDFRDVGIADADLQPLARPKQFQKVQGGKGDLHTERFKKMSEIEDRTIAEDTTVTYYAIDGVSFVGQMERIIRSDEA